MIAYIVIPELTCITPMIENFINITIKKIKSIDDIQLHYIGYNCSLDIFNYFSYITETGNVSIENIYDSIIQRPFDIIIDTNDTRTPTCDKNIIYDYNHVTICNYDNTDTMSALQVQLLIGFISLLGLYVLYLILCKKTTQLENSGNIPY